MKKDIIKNIVIGLLVLIIVVGVFYVYLLPNYNQKIYDAGVNDGQLVLINNQMSTGNLVLINEEGDLITKSILEICASAS